MSNGSSTYQSHSANLALEILEIFLQQPNMQVDVCDKDGRQPLLWAASAGAVKAVLVNWKIKLYIQIQIVIIAILHDWEFIKTNLWIKIHYSCSLRPEHVLKVQISMWNENFVAKHTHIHTFLIQITNKIEYIHQFLHSFWFCFSIFVLLVNYVN